MIFIYQKFDLSGARVFGKLGLALGDGFGDKRGDLRGGVCLVVFIL